MQSSGLGVTKTLGVMALRKGANYAVSNYANLSGRLFNTKSNK